MVPEVLTLPDVSATVNTPPSAVIPPFAVRRPDSVAVLIEALPVEVTSVELKFPVVETFSLPKSMPAPFVDASMVVPEKVIPASLCPSLSEVTTPALLTLKFEAPSTAPWVIAPTTFMPSDTEK